MDVVKLMCHSMPVNMCSFCGGVWWFALVAGMWANVVEVPCGWAVEVDSNCGLEGCIAL